MLSSFSISFFKGTSAPDTSSIGNSKDHFIEGGTGH